jgi:hypothetical protein
VYSPTYPSNWSFTRVANNYRGLPIHLYFVLFCCEAKPSLALWSPLREAPLGTDDTPRVWEEGVDMGSRAWDS